MSNNDSHMSDAHSTAGSSGHQSRSGGPSTDSGSPAKSITAPQPPASQPPAPTKPTPEAYKSQARLAALLGFASVQLYYAWLSSDLFKSYYLDLLHAISDHKNKATRQGKAPDTIHSLDSVVSALNRGSTSGRNLFGARPKLSQFGLIDYYALFIRRVTDLNTEDQDGCFFNDRWNEHERMERVWQVLKRCNWQTTPTRVKGSQEGLIFELREPNAKELVARRRLQDRQIREARAASKRQTEAQQTAATEEARLQGQTEAEVRKLMSEASRADAMDFSTVTMPNALHLPRTQPSARLPLSDAHLAPEEMKPTVEESNDTYTDPDEDIGDPFEDDELRRVANIERLSPLDRMKLACAAESNAITVIDFRIDLHRFKFIQDINSDYATTHQKPMNHVLRFNHEEFQAGEWEADARTDDNGKLTEIDAPNTDTTAEWIRQNQQLDSIHYQRNYLAAACERLGIDNIEYLHLPGMPRQVRLHPWQVIAIESIFEAMGLSLTGRIIGDATGLGKTLVVIGFVLTWSRMAQQQEHNCPPFLHITLPHLIPQFVEDLAKFAPEVKAYVYHGDPRNKQPDEYLHATVLGELSKSHDVFKATKEAKVIVTSYDTLRHRHGPPALETWMKGFYTELTLGDIDSRFRQIVKGSRQLPPLWPQRLDGCFPIITMDEVHRLANLEAQSHITIDFLKSDFRVGMTASPVPNKIENAVNLVKQCMYNKHALEAVAVHARACKSATGTDNPFAWPDKSPAVKHRINPAAFIEHGLKQVGKIPDRVRQGITLAKVYEQILIRRTYVSKCPWDGPMICESLPPIQLIRAVVEYTTDQQAHYDAFELEMTPALLTGPKAHRSWNASTLRKLICNDFWSGMRYLEADLTHKKIKKIAADEKEKAPIDREIPVERLHRYLGKVYSGRAKDGIQNQPDVPAISSPAAIVESMLRDSPKLRALITNVINQTTVLRSKSLCWVMYPAEQEVLLDILDVLEIKATALKSGQGLRARTNALREFNFTGRKSPVVMVICHMLQTEGLNMHEACPNAHLFDIPFTEPAKQQAIGRIMRMGQKQAVTIIEYSTANTFNIENIRNTMTKHVPQLVAELDHRVLGTYMRELEESIVEGDKPVEADEGINTSTWYKSGDMVLPGWEVAELDEETRAAFEPASPDEIMFALMQAARGKAVFFN